VLVRQQVLQELQQQVLLRYLWTLWTGLAARRSSLTTLTSRSSERTLATGAHCMFILNYLPRIVLLCLVPPPCPPLLPCQLLHSGHNALHVRHALHCHVV
jgi:hypothetical protein